MANEENTEKKEEPTKSSNKLLIIVVIALLFLIITVGVGLFFVISQNSNDKNKSEDSAKSSEEEPDSELEEIEEGISTGAIFPLETFIVNLKIKGSFLKTDIQLVFSDPSILKEGEGESEGGSKIDINSQIPRIRDVIILTLSSKSAPEVLSIEGKEQLREEIRNGVNEVIGSEEVIQVLFTEFIVQ